MPHAPRERRGVDDAVEESLDDLLDDNVLLIRFIGDVINKFFLRDCFQSEAPMN